MSKKIKYKFEDRIQEAMKLRGIKQAEIVDKTGINKGALSSYISGAYVPKQKNLHLIANVLGVDEAWLMGYDVPMEKQNTSYSKPVAIHKDLLIVNSAFNNMKSKDIEKAIKLLRVTFDEIDEEFRKE